MLSTMQDYPLTVTSILRHCAKLYADRSVQTATDNGFREASYRDVHDRVCQLAHGLRALGVTGDQRVATFMWNNQEHLEAYLAVPCIGGVLHTVNIRLSSDQIAYIAGEAEDSIIILDMSLASLIAPILPRLSTVHTVIAVGEGDLDQLRVCGKTIIPYDHLLDGQPTHYDWPQVDERTAAAMCYTSGTTGPPKGVAYSHRSSYLHSMAICSGNGLGLVDGDRVLPIVPMFHANAWGLPYAAVMAGADLLMPDRFLQADRLVEMIVSARPTVAGAVPTIWNDILRNLQSNPSRDISSLRTVVCGGSAVPLALMTAFEDRFGISIRQAWGMTETSPVAAIAWPPADTPPDARWSLRTTTGRPLSGVEARIVDEEGAQLPEDGVAVGELEVRGPWITGSYYLSSDDSKFRDGWLRTGDLGRINSRGYISLTDRAKDVIKSGGEWISSLELEDHITQHPAVLEVAVISVPDDRWQERPLAAVVLREGTKVTAAELRHHLRSRVVRWWLPERWTFVEQIPRTSVGKFDKKLMRARYADDEFDVINCAD
jgi:fatty-acyl-CoA synthase